LLCTAMWIYSFIVVKWPKMRDKYRREEKIETENKILKEIGKTREGIVEEAYRKANLDAVLAATSKDLTEYLSEIYNESIDVIDVHVDKIIKKKWTDSSLNCPRDEKDNEETPPILEEIDGWLIVWKFRESLKKVRLFQYHTTVNGEWVRCGEVDVPENTQQSYKTSDD